MLKKIKEMREQFNELNTTQQKFVKYVILIKVAVIIVGVCILALAWYLLIKK